MLLSEKVRSALVQTDVAAREVANIAQEFDTVVDRLEEVSSTVRQKTHSLSTAHKNIDQVRIKTEELVRAMETSKKLDGIVNEDTDVEYLVQGIEALAASIKYLVARREMESADTALKRSYKVRTRMLQLCKLRFLDLLKRNVRPLQYSDLVARGEDPPSTSTGGGSRRGGSLGAVIGMERGVERRREGLGGFVNEAVLPDLRRLADAAAPTSGGPEEHVMLKTYLEFQMGVVRRLLDKTPWLLSSEALGRELTAMKTLGWEGIAARIVAWRNALNVLCEVLQLQRDFAAEVFPGHVSYAVDRLGAPLITSLVQFAQAVAASRKSPEKVFGILDMHGHLEGRMRKFARVLEGRQNKRLLDQLDGLLPLFEDSARITFASVEELVREGANAEPKKPAEDAGVHPLAAYVINYIKRLQKYGEALKRLYGDPADAVDWSSSPPVSRTNTQGGDKMGPKAKDPFKDLNSVDMAVVVSTIRKLIKLLKAHLEARARLYKTEYQALFFLMNCYAYLAHAAKSSVAVRVMTPEWFEELGREADRCMERYLFAVWKPLVDVVRQKRLNPVADKAKVKDLFTKFNRTFELIHKEQCRWTVGDRDLKTKLRAALQRDVGDPYKEFYNAYVDSGFTSNPEKYLVYKPLDLNQYLDELFEGRLSANPNAEVTLSTGNLPSPMGSGASHSRSHSRSASLSGASGLFRGSFTPFKAQLQGVASGASSPQQPSSSRGGFTGLQVPPSPSGSVKGAGSRPNSFSGGAARGSRAGSQVLHESDEDRGASRNSYRVMGRTIAEHEDDEEEDGLSEMGASLEGSEGEGARTPRAAGRPSVPSTPPGDLKKSGSSMSLRDRLAAMKGGAKDAKKGGLERTSISSVVSTQDLPPPSSAKKPGILARISARISGTTPPSSRPQTPTRDRIQPNALAAASPAPGPRPSAPASSKPGAQAAPQPAAPAVSSGPARQLSLRERLAERQQQAPAPAASTATAARSTTPSLRERIAAAKTGPVPTASAPAPARSQPAPSSRRAPAPPSDDDDDDDDDEGSDISLMSADDDEDRDSPPARGPARGPVRPSASAAPPPAASKGAAGLSRPSTTSVASTGGAGLSLKERLALRKAQGN